jgi:Transposase domain (DUF772)
MDWPAHLLRRIDRFPDLSELRRHLEPSYSHTGRPSVDPELMMWMLLVGYCFGIRSERGLCEEVHLNLAYRWFCRLGFEEQVADHVSLSKNRHRRFQEDTRYATAIASQPTGVPWPTKPGFMRSEQPHSSKPRRAHSSSLSESAWLRDCVATHNTCLHGGPRTSIRSRTFRTSSRGSGIC